MKSKAQSAFTMAFLFVATSLALAFGVPTPSAMAASADSTATYTPGAAGAAPSTQGSQAEAPPETAISSTSTVKPEEDTKPTEEPTESGPFLLLGWWWLVVAMAVAVGYYSYFRIPPQE